MNPHHALGMNGTIPTRQKLIIIAGSLLTVMGLSSLASELWRTFTGVQVGFRWPWIGVALAVTAIGLMLIQTLNPMRVFGIAWQLWMTRYPGGRRSTDPPPDTAPPPVPPHLWPHLPPRIRRIEIAKADLAAAEVELMDAEAAPPDKPSRPTDEDDHG
ncbi:MAG: hypothetical protein ACRDQZ_04760 [Mycobacteriales bacterium]